MWSGVCTCFILLCLNIKILWVRAFLGNISFCVLIPLLLQKCFAEEMPGQFTFSHLADAFIQRDNRSLSVNTVLKATST